MSWVFPTLQTRMEGHVNMNEMVALYRAQRTWGDRAGSIDTGLGASHLREPSVSVVNMQPPYRFC